MSEPTLTTIDERGMTTRIETSTRDINGDTVVFYHGMFYGGVVGYLTDDGYCLNKFEHRGITLDSAAVRRILDEHKCTINKQTGELRHDCTVPEYHHIKTFTECYHALHKHLKKVSDYQIGDSHFNILYNVYAAVKSDIAASNKGSKDVELVDDIVGNDRYPQTIKIKKLHRFITNWLDPEDYGIAQQLSTIKEYIRTQQ